MRTFKPCLSILPPAQRELLPALDATPGQFTLYGGTALALRLGHRDSVDFDFFSREPFEPSELLRSVPYLNAAQPLATSRNTLTCRWDGRVKLQFFGGLDLREVGPRQKPEGSAFWVASLLDVAGSKVKVLPERAEEKDYNDVAALLEHGIGLPDMLGAAVTIYGPAYNPALSVKALTYFGDLPGLDAKVEARLRAAALAVDLTALPVFPPYQAGEERP